MIDTAELRVGPAQRFLMAALSQPPNPSAQPAVAPFGEFEAHRIAAQYNQCPAKIRHGTNATNRVQRPQWARRV